MSIKIIGHGPITPAQLDEILGTFTINKKNPMEEAMDKLINGVQYNDEKKHEAPICFDIQSVLSNRKKNAFTVVWADGTSTVVHCQPGDEWDDEKALAMCFTKKALGNKGNFNDKFNDALDNKMKIILGGAGIVSKEERCNCNPPCEECKCKEESEVDKALTKEFVKKSVEKANVFGLNKQTADELARASIKASNSMKELVDGLTSVTETKFDGHYKIYLKIGGESFFDSEFTSIRAMKKRIREIAKERYGRKPYYYRTWMNNGRMMIDFGHHTQFIEVEGITPDEYAKH